jgi:hypothetical protein
MCNFVATKNDLEPGIRQLEVQVSLKYVLPKFDASPGYTTYYSALDLPDFGTTKWETGRVPEYLIFYREAEVIVQEVATTNRGVLFRIAPDNNPHALFFSPGGWYVGEKYKGEFLIGGFVTYYTKDKAPPDTLELDRTYCKTVLKEFKSLRSAARSYRWKVGPEAYQALERGVRLITESITSPFDYDLQLPIKKTK